MLLTEHLSLHSFHAILCYVYTDGNIQYTNSHKQLSAGNKILVRILSTKRASRICSPSSSLAATRIPECFTYQMKFHGRNFHLNLCFLPLICCPPPPALPSSSFVLPSSLLCQLCYYIFSQSRARRNHLLFRNTNSRNLCGTSTCPCRDPHSHNPQTLISRGQSFFLVLESRRQI